MKNRTYNYKSVLFVKKLNHLKELVISVLIMCAENAALKVYWIL